MSTSSGTVFFEFLNALVGRARDSTDFAQQFVTHGLRRGFAPARFHGVRNRLQLFESDARGFEQHVGGAFNVLHFVCKIHGSRLARAFFPYFRISPTSASGHPAHVQNPNSLSPCHPTPSPLSFSVVPRRQPFPPA